ncbi:MAG: hypothetical protein II837_12080 [Treponema sp.]|nr:hypothetical protein [Treponema sp.]
MTEYRIPASRSVYHRHRLIPGEGRDYCDGSEHRGNPEQERHPDSRNPA